MFVGKQHIHLHRWIEYLHCRRANFYNVLKERCIERAKKSPCLRMKFGAIIFKGEKIIAEGYNYPVFASVCIDSCIRDELGIHHGRNVETCWAIHAEQSALLKAGKEAKGADMMVVGLRPNGEILWKDNAPFYCSVCARLIIGADIRRIIGVTREGFTVQTPAEAMRYSMEISTGKKVFE